MHRLANIMFSDDTPDAEIKLIDFGLSKVRKSDREWLNGVMIASLLVGRSTCTVWSVLATTLLLKSL